MILFVNNIININKIKLMNINNKYIKIFKEWIKKNQQL